MNDIMWTMRWKLENSMRKLKVFWEDEEGMGTIEMVLIIVVLIGLVIIFKDNLNKIIGDIFDTITSKAESITG